MTDINCHVSLRLNNFNNLLQNLGVASDQNNINDSHRMGIRQNYFRILCGRYLATLVLLSSNVLACQQTPSNMLSLIQCTRSPKLVVPYGHSLISSKAFTIQTTSTARWPRLTTHPTPLSDGRWT